MDDKTSVTQSLTLLFPEQQGSGACSIYAANPDELRYTLITGSSRCNQYRAFRNEQLEGKRCEACGGTEDRVWHHWKPFEDFPELELDPANGVVLCSNPHSPFGNCHFLFGHARVSWRHNVPDPRKAIRAMHSLLIGIRSACIPHGPESRKLWQKVRR